CAFTALSASIISRVSVPGRCDVRTLSSSGWSARETAARPSTRAASAEARRMFPANRSPGCGCGAALAVERLDGAPGGAAYGDGGAIGGRAPLPDHPVAAARGRPRDEDLLVRGRVQPADEQGIEHHTGGGKATLRAREHVHASQKDAAGGVGRAGR